MAPVSNDLLPSDFECEALEPGCEALEVDVDGVLFGSAPNLVSYRAGQLQAGAAYSLSTTFQPWDLTTSMGNARSERCAPLLRLG